MHVGHFYRNGHGFAGGHSTKTWHRIRQSSKNVTTSKWRLIIFFYKSMCQFEGFLVSASKEVSSHGWLPILLTIWRPKDIGQTVALKLCTNSLIKWVELPFFSGIVLQIFQNSFFLKAIYEKKLFRQGMEDVGGPMTDVDEYGKPIHRGVYMKNFNVADWFFQGKERKKHSWTYFWISKKTINLWDLAKFETKWTRLCLL